MSEDPKRLLDGGSGASEAERALLRDARDVEPAAGARAAMWAALAPRLPPAGGGGAPPGAASPGGAGAGAAASGSAIGAKAIAVGLIGAVVAAGAVVLMRSSGGAPAGPGSSPASSVIMVVPVPSPTAPAASAVESVESLEVRAQPAEPVAASPPAATASAPRPGASGGRLIQGGAAMSSSDALRDEIALVAAARGALRRGDGAGALAALETARKQHPRGALAQEREVLTIEALAQSGDAPGAARRATAFLRAFPTSPHAAHVRTFER